MIWILPGRAYIMWPTKHQEGIAEWNVKFPFDNASVERRGCMLETVRQMIKNLFAAHGLPCVSGGDALAFRDKGHDDDFTTMWDIILSLLRSNWFLDCAASCIWLDEDGEGDILAQVGKA